MNIIDKFLIWKEKKLTEKQFILILSVLIGVSAGFAAVIIKKFVHIIQQFCSDLVDKHGTFLYLIFPTVGVFLTIIFVKYINKNPVRHGIPSVLFAISKNNGRIKRHNLFSSIITSALTVGFGGSVGLEGPTVATGSAIGSNIGQLFKLNYKQIVLLLGCASAGAMAAIFKAPITAIVFALEVIMLDLTMAAIVPLLIASVCAVLTSYSFMGQNYLYPFEVAEKFKLDDTIYYIIFGFFAGFTCVYFIRMYKYVTRLFDKIQNIYLKLIIGGFILGGLVRIFPSLYGEGYDVINDSLHGFYTYLFDGTFYKQYEASLTSVIVIFAFVIAFKVIATSVTFSAGGVGGVFAPTLFLGANTGLLFSNVLNSFGLNLNESNFALAGMAGLIAGVIHAPLTAIFLIAEITGGYSLFIPLMIVSTISYMTIRVFESNSVYTYQLAQRGELITHHKDKAVLMRLNIYELLENDFNVIHPDNTLGELVEVITRAHRNIFPVTEKDGQFKGIVKLDDIRNIMFKQDLYKEVLVKDLMFMPEYTIDPSDTMEEVAHKFQVSNRFNIAVLKKGKYLGFVSRARLFSAYRKALSEVSDH